MTTTTEQLAVIDAPLAGPHLVDAGAGTGKTYTLVERAVALVASGRLKPEELLIVTFTRSAAAEIAERLEQRFASQRTAGRPTCGTFHQIAAAILREFAYETGTSPDVRAVDDARARGIFANAFHDLVHGKLGVDTSMLPLLDRTRVLERNLAGIALRLKNTAIDVDRFEREALAAASGLETLPFGAVGQMKIKGGYKSGWPQPSPPLTVAERFEEARRERINVVAVAALFRHFDRLLEAEHLLTFGDVLTHATRMLHSHPAIANRLRERWRHAMIDEFQDTNPIQVDFVKALFGDALEPVLVVGDVRQAIYAFNGADPQGIVAFRDMPNCARYPLSTNRRSFEQILAAAHDVLERAGAVPPELHTKLAAARGAAPSVAVRAQLFEGENALAAEADAVARAASELVHQGASPKSIAVLMRSRSKAALFAAALRRHGLAVQLHGGAGFFDAPEVREIVAWLRLVETPEHRPSIVVALQSAAINLGDGAVATIARESLEIGAYVAPIDFLDEAEAARLERFRAIARIAARLADVPLADAVRTMIRESGAEVARLGGDPGVLDQACANLDKFARLAADFASDRPTARIRDFLVELQERAELDDDEAEAELEGERVSVMTVHAAKGLEWDHVFVANVSSKSFPLRGGGKRDLVAMIDEPTRALAFVNSTDGRKPLRWLISTQRVDPQTGEILKSEPDDREEHRLFYVALTRAKNALYVTGRKVQGVSACLAALRTWLDENAASMGETQVVASEPSGDVQLALPLPAPTPPIASEIVARLEAQLRREAAEPEPAQRRGPLSYTAIALNGECPRRSRYHYVLGLPDLTDEAPPPAPEDERREPARRDPARFGRIVHLVLEAIALARIAGDVPTIDAYLDAAMDEEDCALDGALRGDARRAVDAALPLLATLTPVTAEQRFDIAIDGVSLGGYIDLLARDAAGRLTIVDYKTGFTPSDHYALQFALYGRAIAAEYPEPAVTQLLRISTEHAALEDVTPACDDELARAIEAARTMDSDEPRPGARCRTCPYAFDVCDAAPPPSC